MMKKLMMSIFMTIFLITAGFAQDDTTELPQEIKNFINQHFPQATIEKSEKNDSWFNLDKNEMYEVKLSNGTKLDFNKEGRITEIESEERIPDEALPSAIAAYVNANYTSTHITGWEVDDDGHEVELSDGTELKFNNEGQFIKED